MLARSASLKSSKSSKSSKGKGKAAAKQPRKPKVSNRPRNSPSPAPSSDESASASDDDEDDEQTERARMLAALEAHQQSFLQEALPSTSKLLHVGKGKEKEVKVQKAIWEMDMDDFDDEEAASEEDSDEDEDDQLARRAAAQSITFTDPGRASAATVVAFEEPRLGGESSGGAVGSHRDMRDFMSSKVKNSHKTLSMSDIVNAKHKGKARKSAATELGGEEEAHLSTLDGHLSTLLRPLISNPSGPATSQLPSLLSTLPLEQTKALKGHTPLPGNAPRNLRAGQSAKNLERAIKRDEANGVLAGSKRGRVGEGAREALSLREKRREDAGGEVKRQRGLKGAVGRMGGGELRLSRDDIERVNGGGAKSGGRGGRGGGRGGGGGRGKGRK